MNKADQYSSVEASCDKWLENESDPNDDVYELPILEYNANQDALVKQKEGTLEEEEPRTPSQLTFEEGEDLKKKDESFGSCN
jgi:hypothetical protein